MKDIVSNKYPWKDVHCGREDCLLCESALNQPESSSPEYKGKLSQCFQKESCMKDPRNTAGPSVVGPQTASQITQKKINLDHYTSTS